MAVEVLWLRGRANAEAAGEAERMIDTRTGPTDLTKLLVVDDTGLLAEHAAVYHRLISGQRVDYLLCVAAGPRTEVGAARLPLLPDSLAGRGWVTRTASTGATHPGRGSRAASAASRMAWPGSSNCSMSRQFSTKSGRPSMTGFRTGWPVRGCDWSERTTRRPPSTPPSPWPSRGSRHPASATPS